VEVEPITAGGHTEKLLAAWLAVRNALEASPPTADAAPTPLQGAHDAPAGVHGEHELTAPVSEPALPGADADPSHETATVQTTWRAPTPAVDVPHPSDEGTPTAPAAQSDLAVPNALLAPAMLTGLQIDPSFAWPR